MGVPLFLFVVMAHVHLTAQSDQPPRPRPLASYIGTYETQGQDRTRILVVDDHLVSMDGAGTLERLNPTSSAATYAAPGGVLFEFRFDDGTAVSQLAIHRLTGAIRADKIRMSEDLLGRYVGIYRLSGGFTFAVTRERDQLFVQGTGQVKIPIWPDAENAFFVHEPGTSDLAILKFTADSTKKVSTVTIEQNGATDTGQRQ